MKLSEFCLQIFNGTKLEDKMLSTEVTEFDDFDCPDSLLLEPARSTKLQFSDKRVKFPKGQNLFSKKGKALALHTFANHELLATEIMAMILLKFAHDTNEMLRFKKAILKTLKDEQKHFKLYCKLLNDLGYEFGDFPLSSFFWKWARKITTPQEYLSVMAITFEGANLDFAHYFSTIYRENGDDKIADVLHEVYVDELSHVALGGHYLNQWRGDKSLWDYYINHLPFPITAARAKGIRFYRASRSEAGFDESFIDALEKYRDEFRVTERKTWKK